MNETVRVACIQAESVVDPAGHYDRPDVLSLKVTPHT